ncbi:MAG TPA: 50S ribosomal protein L11 methyltransferase [Thermodesulfovibrionales bacterium]|nr:50S ribosomal protein L11 methyltransferase [Thermodesulfovibrionales bacterium]
MAHFEFTITNFGNSKDALLNRMNEMGCLGVTDYGEKVIAYFKDTHDVITLRDGLNSFRKILEESALDHGFSFDYVYLSERDWNESWKKKFVPIDVGERLSILPPWEMARDNRIPLIIDPGMAFGTGHHETTKTCLMLIEKYAATLLPKEGITPPSPPLTLRGGRMGLRTFLDVGTGTGVLAIAASRLGFSRVTGVDIDPLAVDAATRNARLNNLENVEIREGGISGVEGAFDMIAANLMSDVLIKIAPEIASHLDRAGTAILSGMLVGQEDEVIMAMTKEGLETFEKYYDGRWASLAVKHKG